MKSILAAGVRLGDAEKGILIFNEHGEILKYFETSFEPHSFYQNPHNANDFLAFVKEGAQSARLNLINDELTYFDSTKDNFFYGHAQFSPDGKIVYASERMASGKGRIVLRETETLQVKGIFPIPGFGPHDLILRDQGRTIAVVVDNFVHTVGKFLPSEVLLLDSISGKVINKSILDDEELCLGHLAVSQDETIFALMHHSDKKDNKPLAYGSFGETLHAKADMEAFPLKGQGLSVFVDDMRKHLITTYPQDCLVIIWDCENKKILKRIEIQFPTGVCFSSDKSNYLITTARGSLYSIDADDMIIKNHIQFDKPYNFFAHLYGFNVEQNLVFFESRSD